MSLSRGLSVLLAFGRYREAMSISEVGLATGLTPATARRILLTLKDLGYVEQNRKRFNITPKVLDLGYAYLTAMPLWQATQPVLERINAEFKVSCSAAVLEGMDTLYVLRAAQTIRAALVNTGTRQPAHVTAMGRVLLASLEPEELDSFIEKVEFKPYTPSSVLEPGRLRDIVAEVKRQNYALVDQELDFGLRAIAVPIRDKTGRAVAAMNAAGHSRSIECSFLVENVLPVMFEGADEIRAMLR